MAKHFHLQWMYYFFFEFYVICPIAGSHRRSIIKHPGQSLEERGQFSVAIEAVRSEGSHLWVGENVLDVKQISDVGEVFPQKVFPLFNVVKTRRSRQDASLGVSQNV